jgi:hypothetical protein
MKKRNYEIPTMKVVKLRQRPQLLVGSAKSVKATMKGVFDEEDIDE